MVQYRERNRDRNAHSKSSGIKKTPPRPSSTSKRGQLLIIVRRHELGIDECRVKPMRRACGQDATKDTLKYVTKTLRI